MSKNEENQSIEAVQTAIAQELAEKGVPASNNSGPSNPPAGTPAVDSGEMVIPAPPESERGERMRLTRAEYERAMQVKRMVEETGHVTNLCDFDYVQYAIGTVDDPMEQVLARIFTMQCFRESYDIQETPRDGIELFYQLTTQLQPGLILDIEYVPAQGNFFSVCDMACLFPSRFVTKGDWKVALGGVYYSFHCQFPDFTCMRIGQSGIMECMDAGLDNFDLTFGKKYLHEVMKAYPKRQKDYKFCNTPMVPNMLYNIWKHYLPEQQKETFVFGYEIEGLEGQSIVGLYKIPSPERVMEKLIIKVYKYLCDRETNRNLFRLENATIIPDTDSGGDENR